MICFLAEGLVAGGVYNVYVNACQGELESLLIARGSDRLVSRLRSQLGQGFMT